MEASHFELTELIHDDNLKGPLCLYVYEASGYHRGGKWFRDNPYRQDGEINTDEAKSAALVAITKGLEVRITNGADYLVFHSQGGKILYPPDGEKFWERVR